MQACRLCSSCLAMDPWKEHKIGLFAYSSLTFSFQVFGMCAFKRLLSHSWAEDEVVVGAGVAGVGGGGIVLGVGVCVWAGILEGLGAGGGGLAGAVGVDAVVTTVLVGGLAEGLQVVDGASGCATLVSVGGLVHDVDGLDGGWQVVGVLHASRRQSEPACCLSEAL